MINRQAILDLLQRRVPGLLAIYVFGSRSQGTAGPDSDLDLAVRWPVMPIRWPCYGR